MDLSAGLGNVNAGPWVSECRILKLDGSGWMDSPNLRRYLHRCYKAAERADATPSRGLLIELEQAVKTLEREVSIYAHSLSRYQAKVGEFVAEVVKARTTFVPPGHPNGGFEVMDLDTFVDRIGKLHGKDPADE